MNRRTFVKTLPALTLLAGTGAGLAQESSGSAPELKPITLPKPETERGNPSWPPLRIEKQRAMSAPRNSHRKSYYYVGTGLIAANVFLFAASQGLAAWFHNCNRENTAKEFKLSPEQRVLFAQTVGYPV